MAIFPRKLADKFGYYATVLPYMLDSGNRTRLVLTLVTQLDAADDRFNDHFVPNYTAALNPATNTKVVRDARNADWKFIEGQLTYVYGEIPNSALNGTDRLTLNLKERDTNPSERPQIDSIPYVKIVSIGGGRLRVIARTDSDDSRASIHPDADGIETVLMIVPVDAPPPASPAACTIQQFSTEARFEIECGAENLGKRVYAFCRWKNNSDPSKSGPFSDLITTVIGGSGDGG